jgi:hypothetical protein
LEQLDTTTVATTVLAEIESAEAAKAGCSQGWGEDVGGSATEQREAKFRLASAERRASSALPRMKIAPPSPCFSATTTARCPRCRQRGTRRLRAEVVVLLP